MSLFNQSDWTHLTTFLNPRFSSWAGSFVLPDFRKAARGMARYVKNAHYFPLSCGCTANVLNSPWTDWLMRTVAFRLTTASSALNLNCPTWPRHHFHSSVLSGPGILGCLYLSPESLFQLCLAGWVLWIRFHYSCILGFTRCLWIILLKTLLLKTA